MFCLAEQNLALRLSSLLKGKAFVVSAKIGSSGGLLLCERGDWILNALEEETPFSDRLFKGRKLYKALLSLDYS